MDTHKSTPLIATATTTTAEERRKYLKMKANKMLLIQPSSIFFYRPKLAFLDSVVSFIYNKVAITELNSKQPHFMQIEWNAPISMDKWGILNKFITPFNRLRILSCARAVTEGMTNIYLRFVNINTQFYHINEIKYTTKETYVFFTSLSQPFLPALFIELNNPPTRVYSNQQYSFGFT